MLTKEEVYARVEQADLCGPLPEEVASVVRVLYAPGDTGEDVLCHAIEACPPFHDLVMKNMNAGFYACGHYVETLRDATVMLGFESIRNMMAYYLTVNMLPHEKWERGTFSAGDYWRHAIATSLAADMLGQKAGYENTYKLFTYGLIHDIGFIVMEAALPEKLDEIRGKTQSGVPQLVAERAVLGGVTHEMLGAWLCGRWLLPQELGLAVEHHHTPSVAPVLTTELKLLYIGNLIAERTHNYRLMMTLGRSPVDEGILQSIGLSHADVEDVDARLDDAIAQFHEKQLMV